MNKDKEMTILVVSSDGYADVAEHFFPLFNKYWKDCKYPIYMVNNSLKKNYNGVKLINAGNDYVWSGRVQLALQNITTEYVLLLLEDYFIGETVQTKLIEDAINFMKKDKIKYYKLTNLPKGKKAYKDYSYISVIPNDQRYGISLQAAIWKKSFLEEVLGHEDQSAWGVEINQLKSVEKTYTNDISGAVVDTRNIIDIHNGVIKGEWVPETLSYFERRGYKINTGERKVMSKQNQFIFKLERFFINIFSTQIRKNFKRFLSYFGFKFTSEY